LEAIIKTAEPKNAKNNAPVKAKTAPKARTTAHGFTEPSKSASVIRRPSIFTPELADSICELIAAGKLSHQVAKKLNFSEKSLYLWLRKDADFLQQYARARELAVRHAKRPAAGQQSWPRRQPAARQAGHYLRRVQHCIAQPVPLAQPQ
jgi:hypothetical protein